MQEMKIPVVAATKAEAMRQIPKCRELFRELFPNRSLLNVSVESMPAAGFWLLVVQYEFKTEQAIHYL